MEETLFIKRLKKKVRKCFDVYLKSLFKLSEKDAKTMIRNEIKKRRF